MRIAIAGMLIVSSWGCPPAETGNQEEEQTSTGGEGETVVVVERVDENEPEPVDEPAETTDATTCTSSSDCPEGQLCAGEEGCDVAWTCQPPRPCTRDLVTYCGCSGETVQGSGSCPPEPYVHRGACEG